MHQSNGLFDFLYVVVMGIVMMDLKIDRKATRAIFILRNALKNTPISLRHNTVDK